MRQNGRLLTRFLLLLIVRSWCAGLIRRAQLAHATEAALPPRVVAVYWDTE